MDSPDDRSPGTDVKPEPPQYDGPERRRPDSADRRTQRRGERRATDAIRNVAGFLYKLLTEPPR